MANNEQVYRQALTKWDSLLEDNHLSIPAEEGATAFLLPFNHGHRDEEQLEGESYDNLKEAIFRLAEQCVKNGREAHVAIDADRTDFDRVLTDPNITSVSVVGHGCLASVEITGGYGTNRLEWQEISYYADHLKTGTFTQYMCGTLPRKFNVPLGLFAVSAHRDVHAAVGQRIVPADFWQVENNLLQPVTDEDRLSYEAIKASFPQRQLTVKQEAHVMLGGLKNALFDRLQSMKLLEKAEN